MQADAGEATRIRAAQHSPRLPHHAGPGRRVRRAARDRPRASHRLGRCAAAATSTCPSSPRRSRTPLAASLVVGTLRRHGFDVEPEPPPWWMALPIAHPPPPGPRRLRGVRAREDRLLPQRGARGGALSQRAAPPRHRRPIPRARTRSSWRRSPGIPTCSRPSRRAAQDLERQIQRVWTALRRHPEAHVEAAPLLSRLDDIAAQMARAAPALRGVAGPLPPGPPARARAARASGRCSRRRCPAATPPRPAPAAGGLGRQPARASPRRQLLARIAEAGSLLVREGSGAGARGAQGPTSAPSSAAPSCSRARSSGALIGVTVLLLAGVFVLSLVDAALGRRAHGGRARSSG